MYKVFFSKVAENDLLETLTYIQKALKAPKAASELYKSLVDKLEKLSPNPYTIQLISDEYLKSKKIRALRIKNHICFFKIIEKGKKIVIIRFLYGRRDWKSII
jgi:toxin ParE1/3/4